MNNAPTIVRLIRFPASYRLSRKGRQYIGPLKRSGPVILSERHDPIDVTFRINVPGVTFLTGGTTITHTEAFSEGEQRDFLLPWQLVVDANARIPQLILEIDVSYSGTSEIHTATVPLNLTYGVSRTKAAAVVGGAVAAVALAAGANRRRKLRDAEVEETEVEVEVRPRRKPASGKKGGSSKQAASSSKKASAKKSGSSKTSSSSKKAATSKKAGSSKQAASSKKGSSSSKKASSSSKKGSSSTKGAPSKKAGSSSKKGTAGRRR